MLFIAQLPNLTAPTLNDSSTSLPMLHEAYGYIIAGLILAVLLGLAGHHWYQGYKIKQARKQAANIPRSRRFRQYSA